MSFRDVDEQVQDGVGRSTSGDGLCQKCRQQQRRLPQVAPLALSKQECGVPGGTERTEDRRNCKPLEQAARSGETADEPQAADQCKGHQDVRTLDEPRLPATTSDQIVEAARLFEVGNQQDAGDTEEDAGDDWRGDTDCSLLVGVTHEHKQRRNQHDTSSDSLGHEVTRDFCFPCHLVGGGVGRACDDAVLVGWFGTKCDRYRRMALATRITSEQAVSPDHAVV